ncbi:MAG: S8 family serine peptidase [Nitrospirales bacterium]
MLTRTHCALGLGMATLAFGLALPVAASAASEEVPTFLSESAVSRAAGELKEEESVSSLIVKPRAKTGASIASALQAFDASSLSHSANAPLTVLRRMSGAAHVIKLEQPITLSEARVIAARLMHNDPSLEYAEPDRMVYPLATTPTDPGYGNQWQYFTPAGANKGGANLPLAWDANKGSPSVVVALIDNGYRPHIDFPPLLPGFDFITDPLAAHDGDGRDADAQDPSDAVVAGECGVGTQARTSHWHGTFMLGLLAAMMNNGQGGTGVAPNAGILPVRVIGKCGGLTSDVVDGMRWAAGLSVAGAPPNPNPAKVMSISIGALGACGSTFQAAVTDIVNAGTIIVVATGNHNLITGLDSPANCNGVMAVTGHAIDGDLAHYANVSPEVSLSAPAGGCGKLTFGTTCSDLSSSNGLGAYSTFNSGTTSPGADSYLVGLGTSNAAPHVAGVAALMLSVQPTLTPAQIRSFLQSSARPHPVGTWCTTPSGTGLCGAGLLDALAALQAIPASPPTVTLTTPSQVVTPHTTLVLSGTATAGSGRSISAYAWTQLTGAPVGTIANNNTATASFTAPAMGTYSFQLTATDSGALTGTATATVRVNSPPVLTPVADQTVTVSNALNFTVAATDADGDTPIFVAVSSSLPSGATLSATGSLSWPVATPAGTYTLTYFARDHDANSAQGTVNISVVQAGSGPPVASVQPASPASGGGGGCTVSQTGSTDMLLPALFLLSLALWAWRLKKTGPDRGGHQAGSK